MKDFNTITQRDISHVDGWGIRIKTTEDLTGWVGASYFEDGKECTERLDVSFPPGMARAVAAALIACADECDEGKKK
jgi:hypothetical protein